MAEFGALEGVQNRRGAATLTRLHSACGNKCRNFAGGVYWRRDHSAQENQDMMLKGALRRLRGC